jgi:hypothetical protein
MMKQHFQPIDVATLLQEFVVLKYLNYPTYDKMYNAARAKGIWYNERIHEDISELAEKVYELAQLNDLNVHG